MSRTGYRGPKLPKTLLDQVGGAGKRPRREIPRKDRRREERAQKKSARSRHSAPSTGRTDRAGRQVQVEESEADETEGGDEEDISESSPPRAPEMPAKDAKPLKSILKPTKQPEPKPEPELESEQDQWDRVNDDDDSNEDGDEANDGTEDVDSDTSFTISRHAAKAGLEDEDAEIAALEKKLGVKGKKRSMEIGDDELEWLVTGSDSEEEGGRGMKRKRPEDAQWLRDKRRKATGAKSEESENESEVSEDLEGLENDEATDGDDTDGLENPFSEDDELSEGDFEGLDSEEGDETAASTSPKKQRENPYVAPVVDSATPVAKYVPPSLRKPAASDEEILKQLKRQIQGQLNRLSEDNMPSILQAVDQIYEKNARQHVTATIIDLLVTRLSDAATLNDTFIILHAGFAAALYRMVGTDFGAQLLERIVEAFDEHCSGSGDGKQTLNLIAFLSSLYTFQVVGSSIIFDYIRLLLGELSESNTELLLRLIRTSGAQLRQDDPSALKDIVLLLQRNVASVGEANLSVRTKFMIETIYNLKNNRMKSNAAGASALAAEHTTRMKKTLGSLSSQRAFVRVAEPLRITLADIRDSDKKGKWWLVGASYLDPAKLAPNGSSATATSSAAKYEDDDAGYESETPGNPNLHRLARQQGMNTDVRRAIFISLLSALDYKDAHARLVKLNLKAKQQLEIPRVILHCAGAETKYNPYYTVVARRFCAEPKLKKAFQFAVLDIVRQMGESEDGDDGLDAEQESGGRMSMQSVVNLAKLYGTLIADGSLGIGVLKPVEFGYLNAKTKAFVDVCLTTVMLKAKDVSAVFAQAVNAPQMITALQNYVEMTVSKAKLANGKTEVKRVKQGCEVALEVLIRVAQKAPVQEDDEDGEDTDGSD